MPGMHFILNSDIPTRVGEHVDSCRRLCALPEYTANVLHADKQALLGAITYPAYPLRTVETSNHRFFIEGYLYGESEEDALQEFDRYLTEFHDSPEISCDHIRQWMSARDGEYVLVAHHEVLNRWYFLNDPLGRLPVYAFRHLRAYCLSRDISLVSVLDPHRRFDRIAATQYLLFGFPLGERTLLEGVRRLPGATLVMADAATGAVAERSLLQFNFDDQEPVTAAAIEQLVDEFILACRTRSDKGPFAALGLSGGHDSRAVAAGLTRAGIPFEACTWVGEGSPETAEVRSARAVANSLGCPWRLIAGHSVTLDEMKRLVRLKGGLVPVNTAYSYRFFGDIARASGPDAIYFSGDGGDKLLPALRPTRQFDSVETLMQYQVRREAALGIEQAARLSGIDSKMFRDDLRGHFASYPERDLANRVVRYHILERAMRWLFEGEDRNRHFLWCVTPFYALPFFRNAMRISQRDKRLHRVYRQFLLRLDPAMARIPDAGRGLPIVSPWYSARFMLIMVLERYPGLLGAIKQVLVRKDMAAAESNPLLSLLTSHVTDKTALASCLDVEYLRQTPSLLGEQSPIVLQNLLAITLAAEAHSSGCTPHESLSR